MNQSKFNPRRWSPEQLTILALTLLVLSFA
jgi:hypothetical protein